MKKFLAIALVMVLALSMLTACGGDSKPSGDTRTVTTRTVTDMTGYDVVLPQEIETVINLWHANNQMVLLLGGADKLIGTTSVIKGLPWYAYVYPRIAEVPPFVLQTSTGGFNTEEILAANPDLVITSSKDDAEIMRNAGITSAVVTFRDFDGLKETVRVTAKLLGGDAEDRANDFLTYFDANLAMLQDRLSDLSEEDKPKVYQIRSEDPLQTDGRISICTQWLEAGGGINAIAHVTDDNQATITFEEVLAADPDIIIVAVQNAVGAQNAQPIIDHIKNDPAWANVKAVKEGRLYANPVGTFLWARYSCEEALQVLWTAKLLHPDRFEDLDMVKEVQDFYKRFYNFDMSTKDAELMLAGFGPE